MTTSLKLERTIAGRPEDVFDAWLDPESLRRWMIPAPDVRVAEVSVDPVVGGAFRIVMQTGEGQLPHEGIYRVIDRPRKLVFSWTSAHTGETVVTLEFEPAGAGATRLTLLHERFESEAARDSYQGGWTNTLDALARAMEARS